MTRKYEGHFATVFAKRDARKGASLTKDEVYTLYSSVRATAELNGALAEVGVYRGGSAKLICEAKGDRLLYLFDTFDGMPDEKISKDQWENGTHRDTSLEAVQQYLSGYPAVQYVKGVFPESIRQYPEDNLESASFSFVNLDVDLYHCTLDALRFFYPRLVSGGRIVSHNYNIVDITGGNTPGVKKAFSEYFKGRTHRIIEIADSQCLVIKD